MHKAAFILASVACMVSGRRIVRVTGRPNAEENVRPTAGTAFENDLTATSLIQHGAHEVRKPGTRFRLLTSPLGRWISKGKEANPNVAVPASGYVAPPSETFRKDYSAPPFFTREVDMNVVLGEEGEARVQTVLEVERAEGAEDSAELSLNGEDLKLNSVALDGEALLEGEYVLEDAKLTLPAKVLKGKSNFKVSTDVIPVKPEENLQLSGLYRSSGMFCTQCEAEGFRRITFAQDRPDVMARFRLRLEAPKEVAPVLLGNGNLVTSGELSGGRHFAVWEDPWPKPSYLFALVAGDLGSIQSEFTTASGRRVALGIYSEHGNVDQLDHALKSLKKAFEWDEKAFGLECDLDVYNVVAVNDFNMGAMENKGLNIFNSALTLAKPSTATDADYERIEGVIGHEYFHNWSGNRVTCRDWFQLTLKEGLTVYRDRKFSAEVGSSKAIKRIEDVKVLRQRQFTEDAGPLAHPIRPESYIAMDNFYTATVYEKGAEVIRMYQVLLGENGFRKGMDLYFKRHDGSAVTCDDFRAAMADANNRNLTQFERWYLQAGTPVVSAVGAYDGAVYRLKLTQSTPATPKQPEKLPFHIPVEVGLLDRTTGKEIMASRVIELTEDKQIFTFDLSAIGGVHDVVPSVLRGFSAPVRLLIEQSDEDLAFLVAHDTDEFNFWEAGQRLSMRVVLRFLESATDDVRSVQGYALLSEAVGMVLDAARAGVINLSLAAYAIMLPDVARLADEIGARGDLIDPVGVANARGGVKKALAQDHYVTLATLYAALAPLDGSPIELDAASISRRRLRNACLDLLCASKDEDAAAIAFAQFKGATCMTEKLPALALLAGMEQPQRDVAMAQFYEDAGSDANVVNKWFAVQAQADLHDVTSKVIALKDHKDFTMRNPNRMRALIAGFTTNSKYFHAADGSGYALLGDAIEDLNTMNPQMAARMASPLSQWRRYTKDRQKLMRAQLERISKLPEVSNDLYEVVTKSLND